MFTEIVINAWINELNKDEAYRYWARNLNLKAVIKAGDESFTVSITNSEVRRMDGSNEILLFFGTQKEWKRAVSTHYNCGYYDVR